MHVCKLRIGEFVVGCLRTTFKVEPGRLKRASESQLAKPPAGKARSPLDNRLRRAGRLQPCHHGGRFHRPTIGQMVGAS